MAKGSAASTCPGCSRWVAGARGGAQEPAGGAVLEAAESALGNAPARCSGAGVHWERPGHAADNNKERIWVRALAGLCWGCGEGWLVWQLRELPFLGTLQLCRVGREPRSCAEPPMGTRLLVSGPASPFLELASVTRDAATPQSFRQDGSRVCAKGSACLGGIRCCSGSRAIQ